MIFLKDDISGVAYVLWEQRHITSLERIPLVKGILSTLKICLKSFLTGKLHGFPFTEAKTDPEGYETPSLS